jgi:hypothetical protein
VVELFQYSLLPTNQLLHTTDKKQHQLDNRLNYRTTIRQEDG